MFQRTDFRLFLKAGRKDKQPSFTRKSFLKNKKLALSEVAPHKGSRQ